MLSGMLAPGAISGMKATTLPPFALPMRTPFLKPRLTFAAVIARLMVGRKAGGLPPPAPQKCHELITAAWRQCFSGYRLTNPFRFGICTFGSVSAFITTFSPMTLLRARM